MGEEHKQKAGRQSAQTPSAGLTQASTPGKVTQVQVTATARRLTGVEVIDDPACAAGAKHAGVDCWLSADDRNTLRDQVYIFVKQAMDNGCTAVQNVVIDLLQKKKHSAWSGWKELGWRIVSNMLIAGLSGGWGNVLAQASTLFGERAAKIVGLLTVERIKGALVSSSVALRSVFAHAPVKDDATDRNIAYVQQEYQPAFGEMVLALTTGPLAARFTDAELTGLVHVYGDGREAYSIAAWEAYIRAGLRQFNDSKIDQIGKAYASEEISGKDSMTSKLSASSRDHMMIFWSPQDLTHRAAVVNKEDDSGRVRWVRWISDAPDDLLAPDLYELALRWQLARNLAPPETREAKGTGDPEIDNWGKMTTKQIGPNPDMTVTPIVEGTPSTVAAS